MDLKLQNKRALVTGASRGLGFATALGLVQEGAHVAINSRNKDKLTEATSSIKTITGKDVYFFTGDVSDPATPQRIIQEAVSCLGGLDILVTNSGGPPAGLFETFDDVAWQRAVDLNFLSHVRLIRAALPHLRQSTAASVLTITSYTVKQPKPNLILSNSIRAATVGLTKSLALELGSAGIRFNSILPAWTETERIYELMAHNARINKSTIEEEIAKQSKDSALGRIGTLEEFSNPAVFLVSPAASYITGVMLTVDGGMYKGTL